MEFKEKFEEFKEKCNKPLKTGWIKERKGDKGNMVKFIEGHYVVRALNSVFPLGWSTPASECEHKVVYSKLVKKSRWDKYKKKNIEYEQYIVLAECKMTLVIHPQELGGKELCRRTNIGIGKSFSSDESTALGAALKNAYTDAVKRCGKSLGDFFGLGLTLDEEVAEALGAIEASGKMPIDVFSENSPKSSKNFPWLKPEIYEEIIRFYSDNDRDASVVLTSSLRNKIIKNATEVFSETFRKPIEETEKVLFTYLSNIGVASKGKALPTIDQIQQFLKLATSKLVEGLDHIVNDKLPVLEEEDTSDAKLFHGEEIGYKIIEVTDDYHEKYGNYINLSLAIPTEEAVVNKRIYVEDEEFTDFVNTLQGEELSVKDVQEMPQRLLGQWGLADFAETSDSHGSFTTVKKWRALARN